MKFVSDEVSGISFSGNRPRVHYHRLVLLAQARASLGRDGESHLCFCYLHEMDPASRSLCLETPQQGPLSEGSVLNAALLCERPLTLPCLHASVLCPFLPLSSLSCSGVRDWLHCTVWCADVTPTLGHRNPSFIRHGMLHRVPMVGDQL